LALSGRTLSYNDKSENEGSVSYAVGFSNDQYSIMIEILESKYDKDEIQITVAEKPQK